MLLLEFEVASEDQEKLKGFLAEVQEKFDAMTSFKKTFQKFQLSVDTTLKQKVTLCGSISKHIALRTTVLFRLVHMWRLQDCTGKRHINVVGSIAIQ